MPIHERPDPPALPRRVVIDRDAGTVTDASVVGKLSDGEVTVGGVTVPFFGGRIYRIERRSLPPEPEEPRAAE